MIALRLFALQVAKLTHSQPFFSVTTVACIYALESIERDIKGICGDFPVRTAILFCPVSWSANVTDPGPNSVGLYLYKKPQRSQREQLAFGRKYLIFTEFRIRQLIKPPCYGVA